MSARETFLAAGRRAACAAIFALAALRPCTLQAQEPPLSVVVEYIAGANLYITAGAEQGIATNDTLLVYKEAGGAQLGAFLVVSASRARSVVAFAGRPFPVTRGDRLLVRIVRAAGAGPEPAPAGVAVPAAGMAQARAPAPGRGPSLHGRLWLDVSWLESTTRWLATEEEEVQRSFATPALRLRSVASDLPGGVSFNLDLRASYRYSTDDLVDPANSLRLYEVSVEKTFRSLPLEVEVGRLHNAGESFSGYWDGLRVYYGGRGLGAGVIAGFEPDHADESFSTELPKYSLFLDYRAHGRRLGYDAVLFFSQVLPGSDLPDRTFFGISQDFRWAGLMLVQRLEVDRDPAAGDWAITRFEAGASLPLVGRLAADARYSLRRPYRLWLGDDPIAEPRDQASVGLSYWGGWGTLSGNVSWNDYADADESFSYSSFVSFPRLLPWRLGLSASGSYWDGPDGSAALALAPALTRSFRGVLARAGYAYYRSEGGKSVLLTHMLDLYLDVPLARGWRASLRGRTTWGDNMSSHALYAGLGTNF
jgi:hypothetical protein